MRTTSSASSSTTGSVDASWEDVERHWPVASAMQFEENIGFCAGCNRGAEAARGRLVAFVNFDGRVEPGWDRPLRWLLDMDAGVSVATGLLVSRDGATIEAAGRDRPEHRDLRPARGRAARRRARRPVDVAAASGALMMVRRDEFLALGGFYEPIFMYGEEADYCLRAPGGSCCIPERHLPRFGHAAGPAHSAPALHPPGTGWSTRPGTCRR